MSKKRGGSCGSIIGNILLLPFHIIRWLAKAAAALFSFISGRHISMKKIDAMDGVEFEEFVCGMLRRSGYKDVRMTPASGDYGVDIVAFFKGSKYAFQCKRYASNLGVKPVSEVYSGAAMYKAERAVVVTNSYFTAAARKMAEELQVELWDRDTVIRMKDRRGKDKEAAEENIMDSAQ